MFTIIGGDGQEYGPATTQQIRGWIAAGRANLDTQAKAVGTDEWRRLGDFAEFGPSAEIPPPLVPTAGAIAVEPGTPLAHQGMRLLSRFIDWIFEMILSLPGMIMLWPQLTELGRSVMQGHEPDFSQLDTGKLMSAALVFSAGWLAALVTQVLLLSLRGQSLGKLITGLRIERIDGTRAGFVNAWLLREAVITVGSMALSLLPFIGPIFLRPVYYLVDWCMIFRADRRCLHDLIAGTRVVQA